MDIETVLVPVDGSPQSAQAVRIAAGIAERYGATVHALYVLERDRAEDAEQMMVAASSIVGDVPLCHSSAYGFTTAHLSQHPGSTVLDASEDAGADFIVVPRERPSDLLGKAAGYVLQYAEQPVLSV